MAFANSNEASLSAEPPPPVASRRHRYTGSEPATTPAPVSRTENRSRPPSQKSCIFIVQYGGCSHLDTFDLKPNAPEAIRGPYQPIATSVPGTRLGELLPRLALLADRYCLVRSMTHGNGGHDGGMTSRATTGHSQPAADTPYFGAVLARQRPSTRNVPSYVWVQNLAGDVQPRYLTGGFLGAAYSPLRIGHRSRQSVRTEFSCHRVRSAERHFTSSSATTLGFLEHARLVGKRSAAFPGTGRGSSRGTGSTASVRPGPRAGADPRPLRPASARTESAPGSPAHRGGGASCQRDGLDGHAAGREVSQCANVGHARRRGRSRQHVWQGGARLGLGCRIWMRPCRRCWKICSYAAGSTDSGGGGRRVGRSPKIVKAGRDHWPSCYTALLAGGGIRGGLVYGASDAQGGSVRDGPVSPEQFGATLLHALGVPPETRLAADGFTRPASSGQPIRALFV